MIIINFIITIILIIKFTTTFIIIRDHQQYPATILNFFKHYLSMYRLAVQRNYVQLTK
jgi:hypothetical protein